MSSPFNFQLPNFSPGYPRLKTVKIDLRDIFYKATRKSARSPSEAHQELIQKPLRNPC